jgi:hypothetical protein
MLNGNHHHHFGIANFAMSKNASKNKIIGKTCSIIFSNIVALSKDTSISVSQVIDIHKSCKDELNGF